MIFPLSLPGVFAGSILTFIPAIGDYVNAELLGNPKTQMIGNVIQNRFLDQNDYPTAAALSFLLMAGILVAIFLYARALGTEELTGARPDDRRRGDDQRLEAPRPGRRRRALAGELDRPLARPGRSRCSRSLLPAAPDRRDDRRSRSTTRPASSTSCGASSRSTPGATRSAGRASQDALMHEPPRRVRLDPRRDDPRHAHRARPGPLRVPRPAATSLFIFIPMATPEIVLGASLLTLFVATALEPFKTLTGGILFPLGIQTILIAHIMFNISYVVVTVRARIAGLRPRTSRRRRWTSGRTSGRPSGR